MQANEKKVRRFSVADGLSLAADCWGSPDGAPVLFFHGGGQTRFAWGGTAEALAGEGWYAVSFDLRGHGESDWSPDARYFFSAFADDVSVLLQAFDRPVLVGASLGGIASLIASISTSPHDSGRPKLSNTARCRSTISDVIMPIASPI